MLNGLSEQQKEAVIEPGNVLLTACPGSGKTRALTYKIAYELERLTGSKKKIIAVTFTNRAADEIKKRIRVFDADDSRLWAGTIHAFCLEWIIRPYMGYSEDLKNGFTISDEYNSERLINQLKEEYGLNFFTQVSTRYLPNGELEEVEHIDLVTEYHDYLKDEKLIDFDQILHYAYQLLLDVPRISEVLKSLFHLICVDEYQDTQQLQYAILARVVQAANGSCKMFMVGDADQAIYGSLGGVAKTHQEIENEFGEEFADMELSGNYRSTQQVIDYYRNYQTTDLEIEALGKNADDEATITYDKVIDVDNLPGHIAGIIQQKLDAGIPENEICVLAPTWYMVIPMGRRLKTLLPNAHFDAVGLSPLLKNRENIWFKIARLFLVMPSPNTFTLRKRWASELINEFRDIGIYVLEDLELKAKKMLKLINSINSEKEDGLEYLEECFLKLINRLRISIDDNDYLQAHWDSFFDGAQKRLENPDFDMAKDIESFKRMFRQESGIVVNTCHGIKGEEFDTVIAFGLLQGKLPNWGETTLNAAEKLLYVICSRAKRELHLISERGRTTMRGNPYHPTIILNAVQHDYD